MSSDGAAGVGADGANNTLVRRRLSIPSRARSSSLGTKHNAKLPVEHKRLQLQLHTAGAYAVGSSRTARLSAHFDAGDFRKTHNGSFNNVETRLTWAPAFSGSLGHYLQLLILFVVVFCHHCIMWLAFDEKAPTVTIVGPPVLGIILVQSSNFIARQELRRLQNRIQTKRDQREVHINLLIIILFVALVSMPVQKAATYYSGSGGHYVTCPAFDYKATTVPMVLSNNHDRLGTSMLTPWLTSVDPYGQFSHGPLPSTFPRALHLRGDIDARSMWLKGRADAVYGIADRWTNPSLDSKLFDISLQWTNPSSTIKNTYVQCDPISNIPINLRTANTTLTLHTTDSEGCGADFVLTLKLLTPTQNESLWQFAEEYRERAAYDLNNLLDPNGADRLYSFDHWLSGLAMKSSKPGKAVAISPQWLPATSLHRTDDCGQKLGLAIPMDPVSFLSPNGGIVNILTTFCSLVVRTSWPPTLTPRKHVDIFSMPLQKAPFQNSRPAHIWAESAHHVGDYNGMSYYDDSLVEEAQQLHVWQDRTLSQFLGTALRQQVQHEAVFSDLHTFQRIEYAFSSISTSEDLYPAIAYASDQLMAYFLNKLSALNGLLSRQCQKHPLTWFILDRDSSKKRYASWKHTYVYDTTVQKRLWFLVPYYATLCVVVYRLRKYYQNIDKSPSGIPWDISSIAARAAVLCGSTLNSELAGTNDYVSCMDDLMPIKLGRWVATEKDSLSFSSWRADTLLSAKGIKLLHRATRRRSRHRTALDRHNWLSNPWHAFPGMAIPLTMILALFFYLLTWDTRERLSLDFDKFKNASPLISIVLDSRYLISRWFAQMVMARLIPLLLTIFLSGYWWDLVVFFYKTRLPWTGLIHPHKSKQNLTLDYFGTTYPVVTAMRHRHLMLALLLLMSPFMQLWPIASILGSQMTWKTSHGELVSGTRSWQWQPNLDESQDPIIMRKVLRDAISTWRNVSALPTWTSYREALIRPDFEPSRNDTDESRMPDDWATQWQYQTEAVQAELQCSSLRHKHWDQPGTSINVKQVWNVTIDGKYTWSNDRDELSVLPCHGAEVQHQEILPWPTEVTCARWQLERLKSTTSANEEHAWLISMIQAWSSRSARFILCRPKISVVKGEAELLSRTGHIEDAFVFKFTSDMKTPTEDDSAATFSKMLNRSVFTPDQMDDLWRQPATAEGISFTNTSINLPKFHGDILSFMTSMDAIRSKTTSVDLYSDAALAELSSTVFSTIFSIAAQTTDMFKVPAPPTHVIATPVIREEVLRFPTIERVNQLYYIIMAVIIILHSATTLIYRKYYLFPIVPERLINTWRFLYGSSVVSEFARRIPNPETLTLRQFYSRVDSLNSRYVFQMGDNVTGWQVETVQGASDVETELDEDHEQRAQRELEEAERAADEARRKAQTKRERQLRTKQARKRFMEAVVPHVVRIRDKLANFAMMPFALVIGLADGQSPFHSQPQNRQSHQHQSRQETSMHQDDSRENIALNEIRRSSPERGSWSTGERFMEAIKPHVVNVRDKLATLAMMPFALGTGLADGQNPFRNRRRSQRERQIHRQNNRQGIYLDDIASNSVEQSNWPAYKDDSSDEDIRPYRD